MLLKIPAFLKGGDIVTKRELFLMYLLEDVQAAEDRYKSWLEACNYYLSVEDKCSKELITYYRKETDVAFAIWQYKLKCYNKQTKLNPISE